MITPAARHLPQHGVGLVGPRAGSGGHQAWASCSASRSPRRPRASHAWPISITIPVGRETRASTANRSGVTDHSSSSSRVSASTGSSPSSTRRRRRAPSARPTSPPTARAGLRASARPRRGPRTAPTARRPRLPEPDRPAHRLQRHLQLTVVGLERGQPRGQAVVRGRSAIFERGDRPVGVRAARGRARTSRRATARRPDPVSQGPRGGFRSGRSTRGG